MLAALAGIALIVVLIVVLITIANLHPFLALIFGALTVGIVAGVNIGEVLGWFADGFGTTAARCRHPHRARCDVRQAPRRSWRRCCR